MNVPRTHPIFAGLWLAMAMASAVPAAETFASVYLSEFLVENGRGLRDEQRSRSGWIELHNAGQASVNLNGWFLTDTPTNLTKWRFPAVVLLPDKYFVVFASAKDRTNDLLHLHANFRLAGQSYLALVNPATNVISEFRPPFPAPSADVSFGRVRGEPAISGPFPRPTPGKPNVSSGPGFAPEVVFSRPGGTFTNSFRLELSTSSSGPVIRYTRDGTLPNSNSPAYSGPLEITNTAHIRARAYEAGRLPGPPQSAAYLELFTNVLGFTSTLPVLVLDTLGRSLPVSAQQFFVHASLFEPIYGRTSLTNPPTLATRAGFRVRGSTSSGFPQTPFALEFLDEFNEERPLPMLDLPADSDWILYAPNVYDMVMIHNPFIYQLSRDMGRYSPRTCFVEVFLTRSAGRVKEAHYHGLYVLTEKISVGKHRVNIDRLDADDRDASKVTGGYLLKVDRVGPGENGLLARDGRGVVYVEPKEETMDLPQRAPQKEYLHSFLAQFEQALASVNWKDSTAGYPAYLDVPAAIDFHVLEVLSGNVDAMVLSTYFHKPRQGKIVFGPHWDFDRALGSTDERDADPRRWETGPFFSGPWWQTLFRDPDFWQAWVDRWQELRVTHFGLTNLYGLIDRLAGQVREAQPREYAKWGLQPRGGSYQGEVDHMKDWLSNRLDFIDGQLVQPPKIKRAGSQAKNFLLTFSAETNAIVYYTLDGSDPRLPQGAVSSNAVAYTEPLVVKADVRVFARAHDPKKRQRGGPPTSTPWSGPAQADLAPGRR